MNSCVWASTPGVTRTRTAGGSEPALLTPPATSASMRAVRSMNSVGLLVVSPTLVCEQVEVGVSVSIDVLRPEASADRAAES